MDTRKQHWQKTDVPNLFKLADSGTYYVRVKIAKRPYRQSLETSTLRIAKHRLRDWLLEHQLIEQEVASPSSLASLAEEYISRLKTSPDVAPRTVDYKQEQVDTLRKMWPPFASKAIADLANLSCINCRALLAAKYSPTRTNGALTVLRELLVLAEKKGMILDAEKLLKDVKFVKAKPINLKNLPSAAQFEKISAEIHRRCGMVETEGWAMFDFLALSGCRIESAQHVYWEDVNWEKNELFFRKAKRGSYTIPIFPKLQELLRSLEKRKHKPTSLVLKTKGCREVLRNVCASLNLPHMSHHTLRHLFATQAIEKGIDIPTLSRWLGHRDGGALVMRVYGHLRNEHSQEMAKLL